MERNIAVIGAGYWGKNLVRNFWELGALSTVCDVDIDKLQDFKSKYPNIKITSSFKEILEDGDIKGVVIATPAVYHYQIAKESLLNGKDVFVEKPLALKVDEGEELVDLAKEQKRILMVGHILQYHNAVVKLKELIDKGELGKIQYIYSNRLNIGKIRTEENILWSFAPHDISVILMLLNEFPESVYTTGGSYLQRRIADVTVTTMSFSSGVRAHIFVSWLHPFKEQKLVVVGDRKMAVFDDLSKEKLFIYPHKVEWANRIPVASRAEAEVVPIAMEEPLKVECKHFLDRIQKGLPPKTDGSEGLRVLKTLHASQESLNNSGKVISLNKSNFFVHESSYIDDGVEIGEGTKIWHFSHILKGSIVGKNCIIGQNVVIGPDVTIGDKCKVQNNVSLYKGVTLEDEVFCGPSCVFTNVYSPRAFIERKHEFRNTLIKKGATIGANATIVCGVTIGKYAMLGAGAVIKSDVPDNAIVAGVPAKQMGWACKCGTTLDFKDNHAICNYCGSEYGLESNRLIIIKEEAV